MVPNIDIKGFLIGLVIVSAAVGWVVIESVLWLLSHVEVGLK